MALIEWFLWRRWEFIVLTRCEYSDRLVNNLRKVNFGHCRDYPFIYRDMLRIIRRNREANISASQRSDTK